MTIPAIFLSSLKQATLVGRAFGLRPLIVARVVLVRLITSGCLVLVRWIISGFLCGRFGVLLFFARPRILFGEIVNWMVSLWSFRGSMNVGRWNRIWVVGHLLLTTTPETARSGVFIMFSSRCVLFLYYIIRFPAIILCDFRATKI